MIIKEFVHFLEFESRFGVKVISKDLVNINKLYFKEYYLNKLIDFIDNKEIQATFFFSTKGICKRKSIIKRLFSRGHEICSHGYNHYNFSRLSKEEIFNDFKTSDKLFNKLDLCVRGFRPPFLCFNPNIVKAAKRFNYDYISSQLGLDKEFFYENGLKEVGVISPYDWQGLVIMDLKFKELLNIWNTKRGILLLHPWIISPYYEQLNRFIKTGKDYRVCSNNKIKISFDIN